MSVTTKKKSSGPPMPSARGRYKYQMSWLIHSRPENHAPSLSIKGSKHNTSGQLIHDRPTHPRPDWKRSMNVGSDMWSSVVTNDIAVVQWCVAGRTLMVPSCITRKSFWIRKSAHSSREVGSSLMAHRASLSSMADTSVTCFTTEPTKPAPLPSLNIASGISQRRRRGNIKCMATADAMPSTLRSSNAAQRWDALAYGGRTIARSIQKSIVWPVWSTTKSVPAIPSAIFLTPSSGRRLAFASRGIPPERK